MSTLIEARDLQLGYGRRTVLRGVSLRIEQGQFWFILGPNGEGKSTLVRSLLGLLRPQSGTWQRTFSGPWLDQVGFVPQRCEFNPTLSTTVREFVSLGLVGLQVTRDDQHDRLTWALDRVGMLAQRSRDYWSLSGGQRQRVLLARALIRRPSLLILDEPTNGLDLTSEEVLLAALQRLNREDHLTILLVTHDLPLAARFATHLALLHGGRVEQGPAAELLASGALERAYGMPIPLVLPPPAGAEVPAC